ncbi:MAG: hypothetical protein ABEJ65_11120 [bacterium]
MKYLLVEFPTINRISIRRAEPGQTLVSDVFGRNDQLIVEKGNEVSHKAIDQFKRFGVRQLSVRDFQEKWVPEEKRSTIKPECNIVRKDEFSDAASEIISSAEGREAFVQLQYIVRFLKNLARLHDRNKLRDQLEELQEKASSMAESFESIERRKDVDEGSYTDEQIQKALSGQKNSFNSDFLSLDAPEKLLQDVIDLVGEKNDIQNELIEIVGSNPDVIETVNPSRADLSPVTLSWDTDNNIVDLLDTGEVYKALNEISRNVEFAEEQSDAIDLLDGARRKLKLEWNKFEDLKDRIGNNVSNPDIKNSILSSLDEDIQLTPSVFAASNSIISEELRDDVNDFLVGRFQNREQIWRGINQISDEKLREQTNKSTFIQSILPTREPTEPETPTIDLDEIDDVIDMANRGEFVDATHELIEKVMNRDQFGSDIEGELINLGENLEDMMEETGPLEDEILDQLVESEQRENILLMLRGKKEFDPDILVNLDADMLLLEKLEQNLTQYQEHLDRFWELLNKITIEDVNMDELKTD